MQPFLKDLPFLDLDSHDPTEDVNTQRKGAETPTLVEQSLCNGCVSIGG